MLDIHTDVDNDIQGGAGPSDITVAVPLGTKSGDILLMCVAAGCNSTIGDGFTGHAEISTPAGWQLLAQEGIPYPDAGFDDAGAFFAVFWRAITDTIPTDVDLNTGTDSSEWSVSIVRVNNVGAPDNNSPIAVGTDADPTTVTCASVAATDDDSLLIFFLGGFGFFELDASSFVDPPAGMTHLMHMFGQQNTMGQGTAIFCQGVDSGATGVRSKVITAAGALGPPMALMVTVHADGGVCADGLTYFIGTDKVYTE